MAEIPNSREIKIISENCVKISEIIRIEFFRICFRYSENFFYYGSWN